MRFNFLIPNDKIKKLDKLQLLDLSDYVQMRSLRLPTVVKWRTIKSMVVTEGGMTLWQLSENYLDSQESGAIGQLESPVSLFKWILNETL